MYQFHLRIHCTSTDTFTCTNKQFLLLIDVPIQDQSQKLSIYKIFTLDIPHSNFTACYDINTQYFRITQDKTMAVEISPQQFRICQEANGQFFNIPTPFQPLANPPSCITALYAKNTASISARCSLQIIKTLDVSMSSKLAPNVWILTIAPSAVTTTITLICPRETMKFIKVKKPIHVFRLPTTCSATSPQFSSSTTLWKPNFGSKYILGYGKPKHDKHFISEFPHMGTLEEHWNENQLQHLASILSVPVGQLYSLMPKAFTILHLLPCLKSQQEIQIQSGHCLYIQEFM